MSQSVPPILLWGRGGRGAPQTAEEGAAARLTAGGGGVRGGGTMISAIGASRQPAIEIKWVEPRYVPGQTRPTPHFQPARTPAP